MIALLCLFLTLFASPYKSKSRLEAENAALRHQLIMLRRRVRGRARSGIALGHVAQFQGTGLGMDCVPAGGSSFHADTASIACSTRWCGYSIQSDKCGAE